MTFLGQLMFRLLPNLLQHLFISAKREELKNKIQEYASSYLGIDIKVHGKSISLQFFLNNKFGKYRYVYY